MPLGWELQPVCWLLKVQQRRPDRCDGVGRASFNSAEADGVTVTSPEWGLACPFAYGGKRHIAMKIYIIDNDFDKLKYAQLYFHGYEDVECVCSELADFLNSNPVECVVSPANAYGLMDGGYDLAITEYFGDQLQKRVQQHIIDHYYGEQPIGTSFIIDSGIPGRTVIHTPTMRTPQEIKDPLVVYQCMRTTLICALQNNVQSILIPLFGGGCGDVQPKLLAELMWKAYLQIQKPPKEITWRYANQNEIVL